jgi:CHAT domain-containing protein
MVIVTAHGGIVPEDRFFQVVSDDAEFKLTSTALARSVRNVTLVTLFVAVGAMTSIPGRAQVGLAKELLDRGCSTVIGSPWPPCPLTGFPLSSNLDGRTSSHRC